MGLIIKSTEEKKIKGQVVVLEEGVKQDNEVAIVVAKSYIENLGFECEIEA